MRPVSYRNQILPCCSTCKHCEYNTTIETCLCLYSDDQYNLDDSVNYNGQDLIDFVNARQVYVTSVCDKYEPIKIEEEIV